MQSIPQTPMSDNSMTVTSQGIVLAEQPQVQHVPLAAFVQLAINSMSTSGNTKRAYVRAWGDFLAYLSDIWAVDPPLAQEEQIARDDGKRTKTQWVYSGDTRIFEQVQPMIRDAFVKTLSDKGLATSTQSQRMAAVQVLLSIAYTNGYISGNLAQRLGVKEYKKRVKAERKPTGRRLDVKEARRLRTTVELSAKNEPKLMRDRAIIDLMLCAGLRRTEISGLFRDDNWDNDPLRTSCFRQEGGRWWMIITGKRDKTRRIKVADLLYRSLQAWCEHRGLELGKGDDVLFCNLTKGGTSTGSNLDGSVIGRLVAEYGHLAGLSPKTGSNRLSPHDLRRTAARNAFDNGAKLPQIQEFLGHASVETTMVYIGSTQNDDDTASDYIRY